MSTINKTFAAPALPTATGEYDQRREDQFAYVLRLYFNLLDGYLNDLTNLLNTGQTFDNIDANTITANTIAARNLLSGGNIQGQYTSLAAVGAFAALFNGMIVNRYVGQDIMADKFYGGTFYGDGRFLQLPYNQIFSTSDQTAAAIDQAYAITYTSEDFPDGISVVSNSRITFAKQGIYLLTYSISFTNTTNDRQDIDIWLRYKGTDIPNSNSRFSIPQRKATGSNSYLIAVTPYMVDVEVDGDYVEIMWHVTDTGVSIEYIPAVTYSAGVTPALPATPSAIVTIQHASAQFPPIQRVAPAPIFGFTQLGNVIVTTNLT